MARVFGALNFDQRPFAQRRLCSWRDRGWTSLLVQLYDNAEVADDVVLPAADDQTLVLLTGGTTTIESRHGSTWRRAEYVPGRIGMTAPGRPTFLRWRGTQRTLTTHVHLPRSLIDRTAAELWGRDAERLGRPDSLAVDDAVLASVISSLRAAALAGADELYAESAATFLAVHILTRHASAPDPSPPRSEDIRVRRAIAFIRDNYHLPLTLAEIAAVADLSTFHFLRVFKAATGRTPHRFLNAVRVGRARRYLERDDLSVTEIAHLCGFATSSRLAAVFRLETGLSPTAYRNRRQ
ncbi:AraC family transcriptional regulator [Saccharopolyspora sp. K220]|uniref:helix-turn-helix domain-containing protein n=1 Tax=Saccharopolyspora soli TaxID=2926618 RepID=UPI001F56A619|nr:AraC family transcriptional regulator [Saccharopolyspora soli]MCI2423536.1 AraC family transcriptional regulator [Saccharopolyspora soli]